MGAGTGGINAGGPLPTRSYRGWLVVLLVLMLFAACAPSAADLAQPSPTPTPTPTPTPVPPPPSPTPTPTPEPDESASPCSIAGGGGGGGAGQKVSASSPGRIVNASYGTAGLAADRALPHEDRPVVSLCFDVPDDRSQVTGLETITFTPDRATCELVFRAWPNKPETARAGNALVVETAMVDGTEIKPEVEAAGAPDGAPGTLIRLPLDPCAEDGRGVEIVLEFTLTLGPDTPERVGFDSRTGIAWFGTAFPLLAWEHGRGWSTQPAVDLFGEMTSSETFELEILEVIAPEGDKVLGTGRSQGTAEGEDGTVVHRFTAEAVRDVTVTVGDLDVVEEEVGGVRIHIGAPRTGTTYPLADWLDLHARTIVRLTTYFGAFPYQDLWVSIIPSIPSGIEFPGAIQYSDMHPDENTTLIPHELAHMWFYGLVGNNQGRDPWLDESFAEYAEVLISGRIAETFGYQPPPRVRGQVGRSMQWYAGLGASDLYGAGVYRNGGAMLHSVRQAVGPEEFDQLLRDYVDANAHRIVTPADVEAMLAAEPLALDILQRYGALSDQ